MKYLIFNRTLGMFWSNELGWCGPDSATRFTAEERSGFLWIPGAGSEWVEDGSPEVTRWVDLYETGDTR